MSERIRIPAPTRLYSNLAESFRQNFNFDPVLTFLLLLVVVFGMVVLNSALGQDRSAMLGLGVKFAFAFGLMFLAANISPLIYFRLAPLAYAGVIFLLVVVMFFGESTKGSQRWLDLPGLPRFQPSELLKISIPLMIGWYFCLRSFKLRFFDFFAILAIVGLPVSLVFLQPDYGTSLILMLGAASLLFLLGLKWRWILLIVIMCALSLPVIWRYVLHEYHRVRVLTLFNPELDPQGAGWNIIQSKTAIGSGGLTGKGLFQGKQSRLDFLPEGHTDFILAVIGEELGFVWCTSLLVCYLLIFFRVLYLSTRFSNGFGHLVGAGMAIIFFFYAWVNVAMVLGLLPIIGLPLPLVSYGGTSAVTTLASFGVVMAVCSRSKWKSEDL